MPIFCSGFCRLIAPLKWDLGSYRKRAARGYQNFIAVIAFDFMKTKRFGWISKTAIYRGKY